MRQVARQDDGSAVVQWWVEEGDDGPELVCQSTKYNEDPWRVARIIGGSLVLVGDIRNSPDTDDFCDLALDAKGFIKVTKE